MPAVLTIQLASTPIRLASQHQTGAAKPIEVKSLADLNLSAAMSAHRALIRVSSHVFPTRPCAAHRGRYGAKASACGNHPRIQRRSA